MDSVKEEVVKDLKGTFFDRMKSFWNRTFGGTVDELSESYASKIKHPIIGTFILIWLILNWDLVYGFVILQNNYLIRYVKFYSVARWDNLFWIPLYKTLIASLLFVLAKFFAFGLFAFHAKKMRVFILKMFDRGSLVDRKELDFMKDKFIALDRLRKIDSNERSVLITQMEEQRKNLSEASMQMNEMEQKFAEERKYLNDEISRISEVSEERQRQIDVLTQEKLKMAKESSSVKSDVSNDLGSIFGSSVWINSYEMEKETGNESFTYYNGVFRLKDGNQIKIKDVEINKENKSVRFTKVFAKGDELRNWLIIIDEDLLSGIEGDGIQIQYSRVAAGSIERLK